MSSKPIDLFLTYQFLKRLSTPFNKWEAYKLGIIDENGNVLKKSKDFTDPSEAEAWGYFDRMVANLKKLLGKVPGGKSKIASYAAALLLIKENSLQRELNEEELGQLLEEEIANVAGAGNIASIGVGDQGEPPAKLKGFKILKRKKKDEEV